MDAPAEQRGRDQGSYTSPNRQRKSAALLPAFPPAGEQNAKVPSIWPVHSPRTCSLPSFAIDYRSPAVPAEMPYIEHTRTPTTHLTCEGTPWGSSRPQEPRVRSPSHASPRCAPRKFPFTKPFSSPTKALALEVRRLPQIGSTAPSSMPAPNGDRRLTATSPDQRHCGGLCRRS